MDTSEKLKNLIAQFVLNSNYWGYLFSRIKRKAKKDLPHIMGVSAERNGTISLIYNPKMVSNTKEDALLKIIEHEGMHLLNKHMSRLLRILADELNDNVKSFKITIWNYAADAAANEQAGIKQPIIIDGSTTYPITPEKLGLEQRKTSEYYYHKLLERNKDLEKTIKDLQKNNLLTPHEGWSKIKNVEDLNSLARKIDSYVIDTVKDSLKTYMKDRGRLPGYISDLIDLILKPPQIPYYQLITKLVKGTRKSKFKRSFTKINRKRMYVFSLSGNPNFPMLCPFPGRERDFSFKICVMIDVSGSMGKDEITEALCGVKNFIEKDKHCLTTVLEVDTIVQKEYSVRRVSDIDPKIKGRGGTTLGPGIERAKELNPDICVAFTDGATENINEYPRKMFPKKMLWVVSSKGTIEMINKTGYVVQLTE